jgi:hypothetical protein
MGDPYWKAAAAVFAGVDQSRLGRGGMLMPHCNKIMAYAGPAGLCNAIGGPARICDEAACAAGGALERVAQKWTPVLRLQRAQDFEFRARSNDQAIPPDRIVL